jgi:hypothetical protein
MKMKGTEKQVKWAEEIKGRMVAEIEPLLAKRKDRHPTHKETARLERGLEMIKAIEHAEVLIKFAKDKGQKMANFATNYTTQIEFEKAVIRL